MKAALKKTLTNMCACLPQRYMLAFMSLLAVANAYTMRVCLNVAITVMVSKRNVTAGDEDPDGCPAEEGIRTRIATEGTFEWSEAMQGLILSSFFWGYVITHIPGALLADRFGGKYTLSLGILCTAVFTLLTPIAANAGAGWLLAVRLFEGLGEGSTFPAINVLLANWAPPLEKGRLGSLAFSGSLIGTVVGQALTGVILDSTGNDWPLVFYFFGGLAVLWFIFFTVLCYSDPQSHPFISDHEKTYLEETILGRNVRGSDGPPVPWKAMLCSVPLWGLIGAQIGHDWAFFTMVTDLPKYLNDVLKYNIKSNGFFSALPYLVMWISSILSGWFADLIIEKNWMSVTNVRKLFTTIASIGPAAGIIGASYAGCDRAVVIVLFTAGMGFMGTYYPGMKVNALDLSPNFAGIVMGLVNGIGAFTGIVTPYLVGVLTPHSYLKEWRIVFWIVVAVTLVTNLIYVLMASGEIQPWNAIPLKEGTEEDGSQEEKRQNKVEKRRQ